MTATQTRRRRRRPCAPCLRAWQPGCHRRRHRRRLPLHQVPRRQYRHTRPRVSFCVPLLACHRRHRRRRLHRRRQRRTCWASWPRPRQYAYVRRRHCRRRQLLTWAAHHCSRRRHHCPRRRRSAWAGCLPLVHPARRRCRRRCRHPPVPPRAQRRHYYCSCTPSLPPAAPALVPSSRLCCCCNSRCVEVWCLTAALGCEAIEHTAAAIPRPKTPQYTQSACTLPPATVIFVVLRLPRIYRVHIPSGSFESLFASRGFSSLLLPSLSFFSLLVSLSPPLLLAATGLPPRASVAEYAGMQDTRRRRGDV